MWFYSGALSGSLESNYLLFIKHNSCQIILQSSIHKLWYGYINIWHASNGLKFSWVKGSRKHWCIESTADILSLSMLLPEVLLSLFKTFLRMDFHHVSCYICILKVKIYKCYLTVNEIQAHLLNIQNRYVIVQIGSLPNFKSNFHRNIYSNPFSSVFLWAMKWKFMA